MVSFILAMGICQGGPDKVTHLTGLILGTVLITCCLCASCMLLIYCVCCVYVVEGRVNACVYASVCAGGLCVCVCVVEGRDSSRSWS